MIFQSLANADRWRKARGGYMDAARGCRRVLTDKESYWRYSADDQRVKDAVGAWVARARNAHAFALGRKPVIPNFVCVTEAGITSGPLYARES